MPELVGGVRGGAPGRAKLPKGPCSKDLFHWANMSSFKPKAAGSRPPGPGKNGCLKGPGKPGNPAVPAKTWSVVESFVKDLSSSL